ncbi:hypothetical protein N4T20_12745 [Flavobacterium sp. TR2]|uniref:hypothetical protein n=1 Tax=Flavobacterium sp. TR2 TaxID=2977321 RepID=UPI0021B1070F|nr:hypothetical protein [Flavobacterium sp. TR2]UWY26582.1 hypothetical protein N4T20_12745 [Flavobacterium sp. TR2]
MKIKSFIILSFLFLTSCKKEIAEKEIAKKETVKKEITKDEIIKLNIENKLKQRLKNPDSYEFVSLNLAKSFTVKERKETITKKDLEQLRELNKTISSPDLLNRMEVEYSFLEKQKDVNKIALYRYDFIAKGTNSLGGIIQSKYSADVLNDNNYTALSISKND